MKNAYVSNTESTDRTALVMPSMFDESRPIGKGHDSKPAKSSTTPSNPAFGAGPDEEALVMPSMFDEPKE